MASTLSTMIPLGTPMPGFSLPDAVSGRIVSDADFDDRQPVLVMFLCNHCPFVKHVVPELGRIGREFGPRGARIVAINSNDVARYPQDGLPFMKSLASGEGWEFPYLLDATQEVAKSFRAACTPDFFLFDRDRTLVYRGQLDDSRPGSGRPVTGRDVRESLSAVLEGRTVSSEQIASVGCNIKWAPGNAPDYFG